MVQHGQAVIVLIRVIIVLLTGLKMASDCLVFYLNTMYSGKTRRFDDLSINTAIMPQAP